MPAPALKVLRKIPETRPDSGARLTCFREQSRESSGGSSDAFASRWAQVDRSSCRSGPLRRGSHLRPWLQGSPLGQAVTGPCQSPSRSRNRQIRGIRNYQTPWPAQDSSRGHRADRFHLACQWRKVRGKQVRGRGRRRRRPPRCRPQASWRLQRRWWRGCFRTPGWLFPGVSISWRVLFHRKQIARHGFYQTLTPMLRSSIGVSAGTARPSRSGSPPWSHWITTSLTAPSHASVATRVSIGAIAPSATASSR